MLTFLNYLSQELEEINPDLSFYLLPLSGDRFIFVVSPENVENLPCDRFTTLELYWNLTWNQVTNDLSALFSAECNETGNVRDEPLTREDVNALFGFDPTATNIRPFGQRIQDFNDMTALIDRLDNTSDGLTLQYVIVQLGRLAQDHLNLDYLRRWSILPMLCLFSVSTTSSQTKQLISSVLAQLAYNSKPNISYDPDSPECLALVLNCLAILKTAQERTLGSKRISLSGSILNSFQYTIMEDYRVIEQVVQLLSSPNPLHSLQATMILGNVSEKSEQVRSHVYQAQGIKPLVLLLQSPDALIRQFAARAVAYTAINHSTNRVAIGEAQGVETLLTLLNSQDVLTKQYAVRALANLIINCKTNNYLLRKNGEWKLIAQLSSPDEKTHHYATLALSNLFAVEAHDNGASDLDIIDALLLLLKETKSSITRSAATLLKILSKSGSSCLDMSQLSRVNPLILALNTSDIPTQESVLSILLKLTQFSKNNIKNIIRQAQGIQPLMALTQSPEKCIQRFAVGIITHLMMHNQENINEVAHLNGFHILKNMLRAKDEVTQQYAEQALGYFNPSSVSITTIAPHAMLFAYPFVPISTPLQPMVVFMPPPFRNLG